MAERLTGIWEITAGPPRLASEATASMLATLRRITEAIPPDAPVAAMTIQLGQWTWAFRRLAPLTLLEGPDGAYAVLAEEVHG